MRDGAYGQINAAQGLHHWNVENSKNMLMVKTSGGASMTEAINDQGWMHSNLHKLFSSQDFKCKTYPDPPGPLYKALKDYLLLYFSPASFETIWKCIVTMKPFMGKAFSVITILSALLMAGFEGKKVNVQTVLNHNPEFNNLCEESAQKVSDLVAIDLSTYWWQNGLIHEKIFDEAFNDDDDIDNNNHRRGKPLNELATNRQ